MTDRMKRSLLVLFLCVSQVSFVSGQQSWNGEVYGNFGCNVFLNYSRAQRFPGLRVFGALSITGTARNGVMLHYGPTVSLYTKTVGANLNPLVGDIQIDFTNTLSIGYGWGGAHTSPKLTRTTHSGDYYNLVIGNRNAVFLSTNFLLNNHHRNQILGSANLSVGDVSFNYNNDGVPFGSMMLADGFDRYWTGGGTMFIHHRDGFNRIELGFDQFTGYQPLLYELANIIGINVPLYEDYGGRKKTDIPNNFNTSFYQLKIGFDRHASVDLGFIGSMYDSKSGRFWGVQDIIHLKGNYSFHPNTDKTRFFFGGTYTNNRRL